mmetsp:Transcript_2841/g.7970  ORF Transcript_2841/g.7970 Transcript_2841/m.7970 type:complete len:367 (-) Transcript_2841:236-1336(-)
MVIPQRQMRSKGGSQQQSSWIKTSLISVLCAVVCWTLILDSNNNNNSNSHGDDNDKTTTTTETSTTPTSNQLWVQPDYVTYLKTLGPIPKIVHIFFPNKTFIQHQEFNMVKYGVGALVEQNPDWELRIYDDADIDALIANATDLLPEAERSLLLGNDQGENAAHIVEKTDIARLLVMYQHGGLYSDFDRIFNVPLNQVLGGDGTALCLPTFRDDDFMQSLMCSAPKNKLFEETIRLATQKRLHGGPNNTPMQRRGGWVRRDELLSMGPPTFNVAVSKLVFDGPLMKRKGEPQASRQHMAWARAAIAQTQGLIVTARDTGCDGFFSKSSNGCPSVNKREVQQFYGMREWSPQVKERWGEQWYQIFSW